MTEILIEGRRVRVGDDFKSLSPEQQAQAVEEIAAQIGITPQGQTGEAGQPSGVENFGRAINTGIASFVDSLAGPINRSANALIRGGADVLGVEDAPQFSERPAEGAFEAIPGVDTLGRAPEGLVERAGAGIGSAAGAILPAAGLLRAVSGAGGMVGQISGDMLRAISTIPGAIVELGAGAGAGVGGEVAADTFGEGARPIGEAVGGLGVPVAGAAAGAAARGAQSLPVVGMAANMAQRTILPFAGPGARVAASNRARGVAENPSQAARNIEGENIGGLTPAQQSGDPGLASLENRLAQENPEFSRALREGTERSAAILRGELQRLGGGGDINDAVDFIAGRRDQFAKRLAGFVDSAVKRAEARVAKLQPERQQSENSVIVREEIDRAFGQAKNQERNLWSRVPQDALVPTQNARAKFDGIVETTGSSLQSDIPDEARNFFTSGNGVPEETTAREMLALVSKMRQVARAARSGETPNANRARIADEISEGVLDDLENLPANSQRVAKAVAEARAFSRELSETFKQGAVNTIRSRRATGRGSVPAEAALGATVGTGGPRGAIAARDIRAATGGASDAATEDFLRGQVSDRAVRGDGFSDRAAETFQRQNRDVLNEFPAVRDDIQGARNATADVQARQTRVKAITDRLNDKRQSVGAAFLQASAGREVAEAVFAARNPTAAARQLRNAAARDGSGRALDGVKSGFLDNLIGTSSARGLDAEGSPFISGSKLKAKLQDPKKRGAMAQVFTPAELARADRLADQLLKIERAQKAGQATAVIDDLPNTILTTIVRVLGAKAGVAAAGSGNAGVSLQAAQIGSGRARQVLQNLTNDRAESLLVDAIKDPELMSALLRNARDPRAERASLSRINAWLVGTGAVSATEETQ